MLNIDGINEVCQLNNFPDIFLAFGRMQLNLTMQVLITSIQIPLWSSLVTGRKWLSLAYSKAIIARCGLKKLF